MDQMDENYIIDEFAMQKAVYASITPAEENHTPMLTYNALDINEVFNFINKNFDKLSNTNDALNILRILYRMMQLQSEKTGCSIDIGTHISHLMNKHRNDKMKLTSVLQILYQILKTLKQESAKIVLLSEDVMQVLLELLFASEDRQLNANIIACLQLYMQLFEGNHIIDTLWERIENMDLQEADVPLCATQILVQLYDDFMLSIPGMYLSIKFIKIVQKLLCSNAYDQRKSAYFLMRKVTKVVCEKARNVSQWEMDNSSALEHWWVSYIAAMESMEQNQAECILASLQIFKTSCNLNLSWLTWIKILHKKILSHENFFVVCWALEYFLNTFTCADLDTEILRYFVSASNNSYLYNKESYFLPRENITKFLNGDCIKFVQTLAEITWESLPLHFWLLELQLVDGVMELHLPHSKQVLLVIATRIRDMRNTILRSQAVELFEKLFEFTIESMDLVDFITLMDSIDSFISLKIFIDKFEKCTNFDDPALFSQRFYELLAERKAANEYEGRLSAVLLKQLEKVNKEKHGWLRFMIVFDFNNSEEKKSFCSSKYDIDLNTVMNRSLDETIDEFCKKLVWHETEGNFVRSRAVDFFVSHLSEFSHCKSKLEKLLNMGSQKSLIKLTALLGSSGAQISLPVLDLFVHRVKLSCVKSYYIAGVVTNILKYCRNNKTPQIAQVYAEKLLNIDLENIEICTAVTLAKIKLSKECVINGILLGEPNTRIERIEDAYLGLTKCSLIRRRYCAFINTDRKDVIADLLKIVIESKIENSIGLSNSKELRLQMRIAAYIATTAAKIHFWSEDLWTVLLQKTNERNIMYMYEVIVAFLAPDISHIFDKLNQMNCYTEAQKISVICVTHHYCIYKLKQLNRNEVDHIIRVILPLSMGVNNLARVHAQLIIHDILVNAPNLLHEVSNGDFIKSIITEALGDEINFFKKDIRLKLPINDANQKDLYQLYCIIMYVTMAPFDEYLLNSDFGSYNEQLAFESQFKVQSTAKEVPLKLNQIIERGLITSNLISYPENIRSQFHVVASLMEDTTLLRGIARTCEILGIQKFILNINVFDGRSVPVVKDLHIIDMKPEALGNYLIEKQTEGFAILGIERSIDSIKFADVQFPRKCILLLGHEQFGIPCDLMGLLDYAIEIPRHNMESINVENIILEYCKQHF